MIIVAMLQSAAEPAAAAEMTAFGWIFMLASMGAVTLLTLWSFLRIMRGRRHFDPDGTGPAHSPVPGKEGRQGH